MMRLMVMAMAHSHSGGEGALTGSDIASPLKALIPLLCISAAGLMIGLGLSVEYFSCQQCCVRMGSLKKKWDCLRVLLKCTQETRLARRTPLLAQEVRNIHGAEDCKQQDVVIA